MKNAMKYKTIGSYVLNLIIFISILIFSFDISFADSKCVKFSDIALNIENLNPERYNFGPIYYQEYKEKGLPDKFWIKKEIAYEICEDEIAIIRIKEIPTFPKYLQSSFVSIFVNENGTKKIKDLSAKYSNRYLATSIGDEIIGIHMGYGPLKKNIGLTFGGKSVDLVESYFKKVTDKIKVSRLAHKNR